MPKGVKGFQKKAPDVPRMMAAEGGATNEDLEMAHALVALATPTAAKCGAKRRCSDVHSLYAVDNFCVRRRRPSPFQAWHA